MKELKRRLLFPNTCISSGDIQVWKMCKVCKWDDPDHVIHSTQYYIMCISWATLVNLQRRSLKLGRLIILQETHVRLQKLLLPWQLILCQSPPTWFQYVTDFQLEKRYTRPQIQEKHIYMLVGSCVSGTICKYENWTPRGGRNVFNIGEVWNPVCCHGNKIVKLK